MHCCLLLVLLIITNSDFFIFTSVEILAVKQNDYLAFCCTNTFYFIFLAIYTLQERYTWINFKKQASARV